jgi:hypothetical protein
MITVALGLILAATVIVLVFFMVDLLRSPVPPEALEGAPPWIAKWAIPFVQQRLRYLIPVVVLGGAVLICYLSVLAVKLNRADKVKFLWLEFEIPDELTQAKKELDEQNERVISLQENIRELADLVEGHSVLLLNPAKERFFDLLDQIIETAAFAIRPGERSVRSSIWLYNKSGDEMRIVAAYRISHATRRELVMSLHGTGRNGFAPFVLRSRSPQVKSNPTSGQDWMDDNRSTSATTSILGQPISVGRSDDWQAVLCFSTDRDIGKFKEFSVTDDAAILKLFSAFISIILTSALPLRVPISGPGGTVPTPLIEIIFKRYS